MTGMHTHGESKKLATVCSILALKWHKMTFNSCNTPEIDCFYKNRPLLSAAARFPKSAQKC
jgi:hypothetical protein